MDSAEIVSQNIGEKMSSFLPVREVRTEAAEVEVDQENRGSSTEEMEADSPKSVTRFGQKKLGRFVHSQVSRVKEEELLRREDIDVIADIKKSDGYKERHLNVVAFSRPILPCSPLRFTAASH